MLPEVPTFGSTHTIIRTQETKIIDGGVLGDKVTLTTYEGAVKGNEGVITTDVTRKTNGELDGASVSYGPVSLNFNADLSMGVGLGAAGYEAHVAVGAGVCLGQVSGGASHTIGEAKSGGDLLIRPGLGSAGVAAVAMVLAGFALF